MSAPLKAVEATADLPALMSDLAARARAAARVLALAPSMQKNRALEAMERAIRANAPAILAANAEDVADVRASGATGAWRSQARSTVRTSCCTLASKRGWRSRSAGAQWPWNWARNSQTAITSKWRLRGEKEASGGR